MTKITPGHGLSWYVKWIASLFIIIGMITTAINWYPYNMIFQLTGVTGWLWVGILWKDRALVMLNTAAVAILGIGIVRVLAGV